MTDNPKDHPTGNAEKDPDDWTTGDEAMTVRARLEPAARGRFEAFVVGGAPEDVTS